MTQLKWKWTNQWHPESQGPPLIANNRDAEMVACQWIRRLGYPDAEVTAPGQDFGIDVWAYGAVAQVKRWTSNNAGIGDVQRIAGAASPGQVPFFFSTSHYTERALEWAIQPECQTALFLLREDGRIRAVNDAGIRALQNAPYRHQFDTMSWKDRIFSIAAPFLWLYGFVFIVLGILMYYTTTGPAAPVAVIGFIALGVIVSTVLSFDNIPELRKRMRLSERKGVWRLFDFIPYPAPRKADEGSPPYDFIGISYYERERKLVWSDWRVYRQARKVRKNAKYLTVNARPHNCSHGPLQTSIYLRPGRSGCTCRIAALQEISGIDFLGPESIKKVRRSRYEKIRQMRQSIK